MNFKKEKYLFLLGIICYVSIIQIAQTIRIIFEFIVFKLSHSVYLTVMSSVFAYILVLFFFIFFIRKLELFNKLIRLKKSMIIFLFIFIYIISEIAEFIHTITTLSNIIIDFPEKKANFILFSDYFSVSFNLLLIILVLIFLYKTKNKDVFKEFKQQK